MPNFIHDTGVAADILKTAARIMVVGSSGAGKSTLSRKIADRLHVEYFSIDRDVRWLANWTARDQAAQRSILQQIASRERWIIDGSGPSSFDIRLPRTDIVIWMRLPRLTCMLGLARRVTKYYGRVRPDMAGGCKEPLPGFDFLTYIWTFEKRHAPLFVRNFDLHGPEVPIFQIKSRAEADRLLDLMGASH